MSKRLNWSIDGTLAYYSDNGTSTVPPAMSGGTISYLESTPLYTGGYIELWNYKSHAFFWNFPQSVTLDKMQLSHNFSGTLTFQMSSNSTTGIDGSWQTVFTGTIPNSTTIQDVIFSAPTEGNWLRITGYSWGGLSHYRVYRTLIHGEYSTPNFEFWDTGETARITDDYQVLPDATKIVDYEDYHTFKIKNINLDGEPQDYNLSVVALKYGGDSFVPSYVKLSDDPIKDDSWNRTTTLSLTNVPNGGFSDEIRVYVDLTKAQNAGDGYHYWYTKVVEV